VNERYVNDVEFDLSNACLHVRVGNAAHQCRDIADDTALRCRCHVNLRMRSRHQHRLDRDANWFALRKHLKSLTLRQHSAPKRTHMHIRHGEDYATAVTVKIQGGAMNPAASLSLIHSACKFGGPTCEELMGRLRSLISPLRPLRRKQQSGDRLPPGRHQCWASRRAPRAPAPWRRA